MRKLKKIIRGRMYDTGTARLVGTHEYSYPRQNDWCEEGLFRKRTGEYFLAGEGNPASKYGKSDGEGGYYGSWGIIPLEYEEAQEWAENYLPPEEVIKLFRIEDVDDDGKQVITLNLTAEAAARLRKAAEVSGRSMSELVSSAIMKTLVVE
jgi:hypothetical protein